MKKVPNWIIVITLIGLLIFSKFIFFSKKDDKATVSGKNKNSLPTAVNYYVANLEQFTSDVFTTGKIGALNQVDIVPEIGGKITQIFFKEGETVSKGSLLLKLNDKDLQAQFQKLQAQLKLSEQKLDRLKKLFAINGVSQEDCDVQENELRGLKADLAYVQAQLDKTAIVAPFTGVVGLKNVSEGSFVNQTTPVVSLIQLTPLFVEFSIPEKYSSQLKNGVPVSFSSENAITSKTYSATIYAIEPRVDEMTKTIKSRAMYSGHERFYPGAFVKVYANLGQIKDALMVPTQAVIPTLKGQKVMLSKNNQAVEVLVKIGVRTDKKIQILEGISPGDTVVTTGLLSVKKDSKLKLLKPSN